MVATGQMGGFSAAGGGWRRGAPAAAQTGAEYGHIVSQSKKPNVKPPGLGHDLKTRSSPKKAKVKR